jgi:uncharacterized protein CbrC (UPF0167 family)
MIGRRFQDVVERQLALFMSEQDELLRACAEAEAAYGRAGRDEAEDAYGDLAELLDAVAERLYDIRETYAGTLEGAPADRYRSRFDRAACKRLPQAADAYRALAADVDLD